MGFVFEKLLKEAIIMLNETTDLFDEMFSESDEDSLDSQDTKRQQPSPPSRPSSSMDPTTLLPPSLPSSVRHPTPSPDGTLSILTAVFPSPTSSPPFLSSQSRLLLANATAQQCRARMVEIQYAQMPKTTSGFEEISPATLFALTEQFYDTHQKPTYSENTSRCKQVVIYLLLGLGLFTTAFAGMSYGGRAKKGILQLFPSVPAMGAQAKYASMILNSVVAMASLWNGYDYFRDPYKRELYWRSLLKSRLVVCFFAVATLLEAVSSVNNALLQYEEGASMAWVLWFLIIEGLFANTVVYMFAALLSAASHIVRQFEKDLRVQRELDLQKSFGVILGRVSEDSFLELMKFVTGINHVTYADACAFYEEKSVEVQARLMNAMRLTLLGPIKPPSMPCQRLIFGAEMAAAYFGSLPFYPYVALDVSEHLHTHHSVAVERIFGYDVLMSKVFLYITSASNITSYLRTILDRVKGVLAISGGYGLKVVMLTTLTAVGLYAASLSGFSLASIGFDVTEETLSGLFSVELLSTLAWISFGLGWLLTSFFNKLGSDSVEALLRSIFKLSSRHQNYGGLATILSRLPYIPPDVVKKDGVFQFDSIYGALLNPWKEQILLTKHQIAQLEKTMDELYKRIHQRGSKEDTQQLIVDYNILRKQRKMAYSELNRLRAHNQRVKEYFNNPPAEVIQLREACLSIKKGTLPSLAGSVSQGISSLYNRGLGFFSCTTQVNGCLPITDCLTSVELMSPSDGRGTGSGMAGGYETIGDDEEKGCCSSSDDESLDIEQPLLGDSGPKSSPFSCRRVPCAIS